MRGRKPDPRRLRLLDGAGEGSSTQDSVPKGAKGRRPSFPTWFNAGQRKAFASICRRLDREGLLATADEGDIRALAVEEDRLETTGQFLNEMGNLTYASERGGRPYKCPVCRGTGVRPDPGRATTKGAARVRRSAGGRPCSVCTSDCRDAIDAALQAGTSERAVAKQFRSTPSAIHRHKADHLGRARQHGGQVLPPAELACPACKGVGLREGKPQRFYVQYPEVQQQRDAIDRILRLSAELGLSPTSRVRVKGKMGGQPASGLEEYLKNRAKRA
jgi:phage terminase small subunit